MSHGMSMGLRQGMVLRPSLVFQLVQAQKVLQMALSGLMREVEENVALEEPRSVEPLETPRASGGRRAWDGDDPKRGMLENAPAGPASIRDHLRAQFVELRRLQPEVRACLEHLVEHIGDDGLLRSPLVEVAAGAPAELRNQTASVLIRNLEQALLLLHGLEPRGVGARSLEECLVLQLDPTDDLYAAKRRLVTRHLNDIARGRMEKIADAVLGEPAALEELGHTARVDRQVLLEDLRKLVAEVRQLHLRPGLMFGGRTAPRVPADVVLREVDGEYEIVLREHHLPPVRINPVYLAMLRDRSLDPRAREQIREKLGKARFLIMAIERRRMTIRRIVEQILKRQAGFLERGIEHLAPFRQQDAADALGLDKSTVSRAVSGKWVDTPWGMFPMKFFFARPAPGEGARPALLEEIRRIIEGEDAARPLSDQEIVRVLGGQGVRISRRAVQKYRDALRLPSSWERRREAATA